MKLYYLGQEKKAARFTKICPLDDMTQSQGVKLTPIKHQH